MSILISNVALTSCHDNWYFLTIQRNFFYNQRFYLGSAAALLSHEHSVAAKYSLAATAVCGCEGGCGSDQLIQAARTY